MNILRSRVFLTSFAQKGRKNSKETFSITSQHPPRKSHHPCWNKVDKWPLNRLYRLDVLSLDCVPFIKWCRVCRPLLCFTDADMQEFFPASLSLVSHQSWRQTDWRRITLVHIHPLIWQPTTLLCLQMHLRSSRCLWLMECSIVLREYYGSSIVVLRWTTLEGIY